MLAVKGKDATYRGRCRFVRDWRARLRECCRNAVVGALCVLSISASALEPAPYTQSIWLVREKGVQQYSAADGALLGGFATEHKADALAVDIAGRQLWLYSHHELQRRDSDGKLLLSVKPEGKGEGDDIQLLLAGDNLWLALKKYLLRYDLDGKLLADIDSPKDVRALARAGDTVWLVAKDGLYRISTENALVRVVATGHDGFEDLSFDESSATLGAVDKAGFQRFTADGTAIAEIPLKHLEHLVATQHGGFWLTGKKTLYRVDAANQIAVQASLDKKIKHLVADGRDGSVWLATEKTLSRYAADGTRLVRIEKKPLHGARRKTTKAVITVMMTAMTAEKTNWARSRAWPRGLTFAPPRCISARHWPKPC